MNDGVSISEFAREIGTSRTMVQKLLKAGTLPQYTNGTIPLEAGLKAYEEYKNAPKSKGGRPPKNSQSQKQEKTERPPRPPRQPAGEPDIPPIEQPPVSPPNVKTDRAKEAVSVNAAINKAKLANQTFQARLREIEYKVKTGELVAKADVEAEAQWLAEQVKSKLLAIPPRISSMCEGRMARDIEEIIADSINNALKELQKCKYTGEEE